jgi:poly-gamma-glutamate synthesis protein (capsule biosynthesis protein)
MLGYSSFHEGSISVMDNDIKDLRDKGAKLVVVSFHGGVERDYYPTETQKKVARAAIDKGADLVLGHHPHVMQGIELYNGKYIVYSLGNFCFGGNRNPPDKDTFIFRQSFTFAGGKLSGNAPIDIIPVRISSVTERNDFRPTPLLGGEGRKIINRISEYSEPFGYKCKPRDHISFIYANMDGAYGG